MRSLCLDKVESNSTTSMGTVSSENEFPSDQAVGAGSEESGFLSGIVGKLFIVVSYFTEKQREFHDWSPCCIEVSLLPCLGCPHRP